MTTVSMFEAKTNLSKYVSSVVEKEEPFIVISRNGKPVAKIVPYEPDCSRRIGIAAGKLPPMVSLDDFNSIDTEEDFAGKGAFI